MKKLLTFMFVLGLALTLPMVVQPAQAGTIILEGSDAIGFHCRLGEVGACTYRDQAWSAIGGADPRSIAVVGAGSGAIGSGTHAVTTMTTLATAGALSDYVAIYFVAEPPGDGVGCCSDSTAGTELDSRAADVAAYLAAGGTVMIEDYSGNVAWNLIMPGLGGTTSHIAGFGGTLGGASCSDGETVTADGTLNGFTQPPAISCWTHQGYDEAFFSGLGFTHSFFNSPSDIGGDGFSSLLSSGFTVTGTVPEPGSMMLLGTGLIGLAGAIRRKLKK